MDIRQSLALSDMRLQTRPTNFGRKRTAAEIASRIFSMAEEAGNAILAMTERQWQKEWLSSDSFMLVDLPLHLVASPLPPNNHNKVLASMRAASESIEPIVVDLNKKRIGRPSNANFFPPVIVVDGQHRYQGYSQLGRQTIKAWVGALAARAIGLTAAGTIQADHQMGMSELRSKLSNALRERHGAESPGESPSGILGGPYIEEVYPMEDYLVFQQGDKKFKQGYKCDPKNRSVELTGKPREVIQKYVHAGAVVPGSHRSTPLEQAVFASSGMGGAPGASLGQGSGPTNAAKPMPTPGGGTTTSMKMKGKRKKVKAKKLKGTGYMGYKKASKTMSDKTKGGSKSEMASKLQGTGYYGYKDATKVQSDKTKGGSMSEMEDRLMGAEEVKKLVTRFAHACNMGYKSSMKSVAPPGMEHTVKSLKKHFKKGSPSPFKLAWWMHDQKKKKAS